MFQSDLVLIKKGLGKSYCQEGLQQLGLILNFLLSRTEDSKLIVRWDMEFITQSDKISKNLF